MWEGVGEGGGGAELPSPRCDAVCSVGKSETDGRCPASSGVLESTEAHGEERDDCLGRKIGGGPKCVENGSH